MNITQAYYTMKTRTRTHIPSAHPPNISIARKTVSNDAKSQNQSEQGKWIFKISQPNVIGVHGEGRIPSIDNLIENDECDGLNTAFTLNMVSPSSEENAFAVAIECVCLLLID